MLDDDDGRAALLARDEAVLIDRLSKGLGVWSDLLTAWYELGSAWLEMGSHRVSLDLGQRSVGARRDAETRIAVLSISDEAEL